MCMSTTASITAWVISVIIAVYLWWRNRRYDRWNSLFILTFSLIQLIEAVMWTTIDRSCGRSKAGFAEGVNSVLTAMIPLVLLLQPVVQSWGAATTTGETGFGGETFKQLSKVLVLGYLLLLSYMFVRVSLCQQYQSTVGEHGHLVWNSCDSPTYKGNIFGDSITPVLYLIGLFLPLLLGMNWKASMPLLAVGIVTAVVSWLATRSGEFSSFWCLAAVAYGIVALFV